MNSNLFDIGGNYHVTPKTSNITQSGPPPQQQQQQKSQIPSGPKRSKTATRITTSSKLHTVPGQRQRGNTKMQQQQPQQQQSLVIY